MLRVFPLGKNVAFSLLMRGGGLAAVMTLAACSGMGMDPLSGLSTTRVQGYEISESALQQVREGQSMDLVTTVLGTPASRNTFGDETAFYYVETKVEVMTMGIRTVKERTVLAIYFDQNNRVKDKAVYSLEDGKVFALQSRRTPSFGQDQSFIESILASF